jgi:hypothetical protein
MSKSGPHEKNYNFLRNNFSGVDKNPIGILISFLKRLEGLKVGNLEAGIKYGGRGYCL